MASFVLGSSYSTHTISIEWCWSSDWRLNRMYRYFPFTFDAGCRSSVSVQQFRKKKCTHFSKYQCVGVCVDDGWFKQSRVRLIGLSGWVRLHTCCTLSNQCARVQPAINAHTPCIDAAAGCPAATWQHGAPAPCIINYQQQAAEEPGKAT